MARISHLLLLTVPLLAGCAGTVKIVPAIRSDFPETEPLIGDIRLSEAYYWVEDNGEANIALRFERGSILGKTFDAEWEMSLVTEGLPAGSSRLCKLKPEGINAVQIVAGDRRRSRGWLGIAVLYAPQGHRLRGRFHVQVRQQQFTLLGGWTPPVYAAPTMIVVGDFTAVEDAARGRAIRDRTRTVDKKLTASAPTPPAP